MDKLPKQGDLIRLPSSGGVQDRFIEPSELSTDPSILVK